MNKPTENNTLFFYRPLSREDWSAASAVYSELDDLKTFMPQNKPHVTMFSRWGTNIPRIPDDELRKIVAQSHIGNQRLRLEVEDVVCEQNARTKAAIIARLKPNEALFEERQFIRDEMDARYSLDWRREPRSGYRSLADGELHVKLGGLTCELELGEVTSRLGTLQERLGSSLVLGRLAASSSIRQSRLVASPRPKRKSSPEAVQFGRALRNSMNRDGASS